MIPGRPRCFSLEREATLYEHTRRPATVDDTTPMPEERAVEGRIVTAEEAGHEIDLAKGYRSELHLNGHGRDTWIEIHFDWRGSPPRFAVEHVIIDEYGPSIMLLKTTGIGLRILDSWHIGFKKVGRKEVKIVDLVGEKRTEYSVPLGQARY